MNTATASTVINNKEAPCFECGELIEKGEYVIVDDGQVFHFHGICHDKYVTDTHNPDEQYANDPRNYPERL